ncbi:AAA family ATPase [Enterovibrio makurazakiensis]|uniref:AAA family ATPase n=1 Tax=Enterovibrio makurazakiensis TaxID=2910232 RepID=UPI003D2392BE
MKLKKLTLSNFRGFQRFECEFNEGINVLVGLNGHGKTTILDAISIGYGQYFTALGTGVDRGVRDSEIRIAKHFATDKQAYTMESQFPVSVSCETFPSSVIEGFPEAWERRRNTKKGRTTQVKPLKDFAKVLQNWVQSNERVTLPVFGYYGTGRLWKQKKLSSFKVASLSQSSRLEGYRDCMDPESSYTAFAEWLREETIAEVERRLEIVEEAGFSQSALVTGSTVRSRLLGAITTAVNEALKPSGWSNMRYSAQNKEIIATHPEQGHVPVSMLSDGVRNMIGMIADIAYRCVRLNPHLEDQAVNQTHGLVLVDEIDMHLHPQWQQLVLGSLVDAFPNIQFVVTTHSPQVLTTVKKDQILILTHDSAVTPFGNTFGETSNYVLNHVLGVNSRPPMLYADLLKQYLCLIESGLGKGDEAAALRVQLEGLMGPDHSDLMAADRAIKRKDFLG